MTYWMEKIQMAIEQDNPYEDDLILNNASETVYARKCVLSHHRVTNGIEFEDSGSHIFIAKQDIPKLIEWLKGVK